MQPMLKVKENKTKSTIIKTVLTMAVKTFLLIGLFLGAIFLWGLNLPEKYIFINASLPESNISFNLQNRILVIAFFLLLLVITKKKYLHLFSFAPLIS
jgi:hypothetical protein